jgi:hypothetical protein
LDGDTQYNVTSIANNAFRDAFNNGDAYHTITNLDLTIAINLNTIGQYAFEDCSGLTGMLTIPSSVDNIGYMGFSGCVGFNIINAST